MNFGDFGRIVDSVTGLFCDGQNLNMQQFGQQLDQSFNNFENGNDFNNYDTRNVQQQPMFIPQPQFIPQQPQFYPQQQIRPQPQKQKPKQNYTREIYKFRVGVRPLAIGFGGGEAVMHSSGPTHACFLLGSDLFEYGLSETNKHYIRRRNVGRTSNFDWDRLGNRMNGKTYVSPDQLEQAIIESDIWNGTEYVLTSLFGETNHNCHDFVQFCIQVCCGENCGMAYKKNDVYLPQDQNTFARFITNTVENFIDELSRADDEL